MTFLARILALILAPAALWAEPMTPPPGDPLRAELLDVLRPYAEDDLGPPVEFVVERLLVDADRAYAEVTAQRPGGGQIDLSQSPLHLRRGIPTDLIDGPYIVAFLHKAPRGWRVVVHSTGATDAWYWEYDCDNYASIFQAIHPPACGGQEG